MIVHADFHMCINVNFLICCTQFFFSLIHSCYYCCRRSRWCRRRCRQRLLHVSSFCVNLFVSSDLSAVTSRLLEVRALCCDTETHTHRWDKEYGHRIPLMVRQFVNVTATATNQRSNHYFMRIYWIISFHF